MDDILYLTITRGDEPQPIVATSDPRILRVVARTLYEVLGGAERAPVLRLQRELDDEPEGGQ